MTKRQTHLSRRTLLAGLALLGAGVSIAALRTMMEPSEGAALSPVDAYRMAAAGEILLVDIRRPDEWRRTGVPEHGHAIDMRRPDFEAKLRALSEGLDDVPVALICARGGRSQRLSARLAASGFTQVIDVPEGMLGSRAGPGWLQRGLPVSSAS